MDKSNGTFAAGPLDVMCIMKLPAGTYHVAFLEEHPLPRAIRGTEETQIVRLKSKMHHTVGAKTLEEAREHLTELRQRIIIDDQNVIGDDSIEVGDPVSVWIIGNWKKDKRSLKDCLTERSGIKVTIS